MTAETSTAKDATMNAKAPSLSGRIVEITDEDETIIINFVSADTMATSSSTVTTSSTMETPR